MRALLVSTYDLGRQSFGLASPAAWLRNAGIDVDCVDVSRDTLTDERMSLAGVIGFYLPMHTATRLAGPIIERARRVNPSASICAYGLYASLNTQWLRERGVQRVLGPEAEQELVEFVTTSTTISTATTDSSLPRLQFIQPDRSGLPALSRYAGLHMPDGSRRVVGSTDATRGCKHLCRHCPIVPVYKGQFRVIPVEIVIEDIRAQVEAGANHLSFGDPDFLNGPTHARRVVERLAEEFPGVTYDVTTKISHLLAHADLIPLLRDTGCLFITSAVESADDRVLDQLRKGHTRADFIEAVALCRAADVTLAPTFIPFTPWTTVEGYCELLDLIADLDLVEQVAPIQLAIRLLITAESPLLELRDIRDVIGPFNPASLSYPWLHRDTRVDALQTSILGAVHALAGQSRSDVFAAISVLACEVAGIPDRPRPPARPALVPYMSEPWYCCAEPVDTGV